MTSPANNNIRHIDVSDVIAADFRLPDGHVTPAQGQVSVTPRGRITVFQGHVSVSQGHFEIRQSQHAASRSLARVSENQVKVREGHVSVTQGQVKVIVENGSVGQRDSRRLASDGVRRAVDDIINEVADCPSDDVLRAAELTGLMSSDSQGCGRHDDGYSACDDRGKVRQLSSVNVTN